MSGRDLRGSELCSLGRDLPPMSVLADRLKIASHLRTEHMSTHVHTKLGVSFKLHLHAKAQQRLIATLPFSLAASLMLTVVQG